jgi:hypothetical protein
MHVWTFYDTQNSFTEFRFIRTGFYTIKVQLTIEPQWNLKSLFTRQCIWDKENLKLYFRISSWKAYESSVSLRGT